MRNAPESELESEEGTPPRPVDHDEGELESEEGSGTLSHRLPIEEARAMSHKEGGRAFKP